MKKNKLSMRVPSKKGARYVLDHDKLDDLDCRAIELISSGLLRENEVSQLIKIRHRLRQIEKPVMVHTRGAPFPPTDCRPDFYNIQQSIPCLTNGYAEAYGGYVARCREYIQRLEGWAGLGPGEDI